MSGTAFAAAATGAEWEGARAEFPWASRETYLNTATEHPLGVWTTQAMQDYLHALTHGPDTARDKFENGRLMAEVKQMFAKLVNAQPAEIGFTPSTQTGENLVLDGLDIQASGENVVTNDLHYSGSLLNYRNRQRGGVDVGVVKHRGYQMGMGGLEKSVDKKTGVVSVALVSDVKGYGHEVKASG